jgi:hypothetical protein
MLKNDGEKREFQTPGTFKLLDWDSSICLSLELYLFVHIL